MTTASRTPSRWRTSADWWEPRVAASSPPRESALLAEAELESRVLSVGMWLWLAADTFFFAAWWFSFFYLKALNNDQAWRPQGVDAPALGFGIIVLALVILMAASLWALTRIAAQGSFLFSLLTPVSLVFGIAACLFQGFGMWHLGFGLTEGGYAAVFAGLTGVWLVQVLGATIWLATVAIQTREG